MFSFVKNNWLSCHDFIILLNDLKQISLCKSAVDQRKPVGICLCVPCPMAVIKDHKPCLCRSGSVFRMEGKNLSMADPLDLMRVGSQIIGEIAPDVFFLPEKGGDCVLVIAEQVYGNGILHTFGLLMQAQIVFEHPFQLLRGQGFGMAGGGFAEEMP